MAVGDGSIVRAGLDALLDLLGRFAAPTGERGSILLMSGGLIVLGFLFLAFLFRSAIVGDLAPVANARAPTPRVMLPPTLGSATRIPAPPSRQAFDAGRKAGKAELRTLDAALEHLASHGVEARVLQSHAQWKRVRVYRCASCEHGSSGEGCEFERGILAGAFESLTGELAKVHEHACAARGGGYCEFDVAHVALAEVP